MKIKVFFKAPHAKNLKGSGHKIIQFKKPDKKFIKAFKQEWIHRNKKYLNYLNKIFINKPKEIYLFISSSDKKLGGCDKTKPGGFMVYIADKKISSTFFMILFHELCHAYLNNETQIKKSVEKKYHFDIEELLSQLITLRYFKKSKSIEDIPNTIFKDLPVENIKKIKNGFKKFNEKKPIIEWLNSIYNANIF